MTLEPPAPSAPATSMLPRPAVVLFTHTSAAAAGPGVGDALGVGAADGDADAGTAVVTLGQLHAGEPAGSVTSTSYAAAVATSMGTFLSAVTPAEAAALAAHGSGGHVVTHDALHLVSEWAGGAIGAVTLTGSLVAFGKLNGNIASKPLVFAGQNQFNTALAGVKRPAKLVRLPRDLSKAMKPKKN